MLMSWGTCLSAVNLPVNCSKLFNPLRILSLIKLIFHHFNVEGDARLHLAEELA